MYKSLNTSMLNIPGTVPELAPIAKQYGFEAISLPASLLEDDRLAAEAMAALTEYDLKWGLFPVPCDFFHEDVEGAVFEEALVTLGKWAAKGEKLGAKYAYNHIWSSCNKREFDENFHWHVDRLRKVQHIFREHGIRYGFEFLGPHELQVMSKHPFVHTISGVLAIADAADGYTGFAFDAYHWYCGSGRLDDLYYAAENADRMVALHLNDGIAGRSRKEQKDMNRALPMTTGVIDTAMICRLFASRFDGPAMCEPFAPTTERFGKQSAEDSIREAAECLGRAFGE